MITVECLIWDDWNIAHIARHDLVPAEVEEACHGDFLLLQGKNGRLLVINPITNGKMLAVILNPQEEEGTFYPVTARPAAKKERRLYRAQKGGEKNDE